MNLEDLKPAPYNPREIADEALAGLTVSLEEFGDIAGIVWNQRTGNLVCGHQRIAALTAKYDGGLTMSGEIIHTPDGERFRVRVVDWPEDKEKLANLAANNPHIAGTFGRGLEELVRELEQTDVASLLEPLRIDELLDMAQPKANNTSPQLSDLVFQIVVTCEDEDEQRRLLERFDSEGLTCRALML